MCKGTTVLKIMANRTRLLLCLLTQSAQNKPNEWSERNCIQLHRIMQQHYAITDFKRTNHWDENIELFLEVKYMFTLSELNSGIQYVYVGVERRVSAETRNMRGLVAVETGHKFVKWGYILLSRYAGVSYTPSEGIAVTGYIKDSVMMPLGIESP